MCSLSKIKEGFSKSMLLKVIDNEIPYTTVMSIQNDLVNKAHQIVIPTLRLKRLIFSNRHSSPVGGIMDCKDIRAYYQISIGKISRKI
jgi:hypothetical protein